MKKQMLLGLMQYVFAVLMVIATVLYIQLYNAGGLPLMNEEYLANREEQEKTPNQSIPNVAPETEAPTVTVTAGSYTAALPDYNGKGVYTGIYDDSFCDITLHDMSSLGNLNGATLSLKMGFLYKHTDTGVFIYDSELNEISAVLSDKVLQNLRDEKGRALFYSGGVFFYYEDGNLYRTEYDAANFDKGIDYQYPSYLAGSNGDFKVFSGSGGYGIARADGAVIVPAVYKDVYGVSDGRIVAVYKTGRISIFDDNGNMISDGVYCAPEKENESAIGCYFYTNGLTRAYTENGVSVLVNKNGKAVSLPTGFEVDAYSDGVALLENNDGYGYMNSEGRWISTPDYTAARPFYEGLAAACDSNGLWGMIDTEGNTVVPFVFDSISNCSDGLILAYAEKYGNYVLAKVSTVTE